MVQRTREIGVRKTLGASSLQIGWLLIKDYLKLILIGGLIAFPLAYFLGREWLADFVYSIPLNAGYFLIALGIVIGVSVLTIGFYTEKATRIDPVKALKNQN
ncbi:MAG: FtsX-like permease family protein, partial [Bacteroidota bacterium]